ncbi:MAG: DUF4369 domain-containing protein [Bacteroidaceae bacterium]|nr:DUF4369 domain-containing protein [Bacteroidaceae bacterium]
MKKFFGFFLLASLFLASCQKRPYIQGTTSISDLEGRMLYLKIYADGDLRDIDSTRIVHGKFQFTGDVDSTVMANLFLEDMSLMPIVIDENVLQVSLSENERQIKGSALNDSLLAFAERKSVLDEKLEEIPHRESQMIMDGYDHAEIVSMLNAEIDDLTRQRSEMVSRFIKDNMDNVLGPGVFMIVTSSLPFPVLTPEIEEILALAPPSFLVNAYVQDYIKLAKENMEKMNE